jgi:hypothetical protein
MKYKSLLLLVTGVLFFVSCEVVLKPGNNYTEAEQPLSDTEVAAGLRKALMAGTLSAVDTLGQANGFYNNTDVRIQLPAEMDDVIKYAKKVPGLEKLVSAIELQINRAAEDAAQQAVPVFEEAINTMPIYDVWGILNGGETAATYYLKDKTHGQLYNGFKPLVKKSLQKKLTGNASAQKTWDEITGKWNNFSSSFAGNLVGVEPLTISLADYVTSNALYGMLVEIAREEVNIRSNADARDDKLLQRVFGHSGKKK